MCIIIPSSNAATEMVKIREMRPDDKKDIGKSASPLVVISY